MTELHSTDKFVIKAGIFYILLFVVLTFWMAFPIGKPAPTGPSQGAEAYGRVIISGILLLGTSIILTIMNLLKWKRITKIWIKLLALLPVLFVGGVSLLFLME